MGNTIISRKLATATIAATIFAVGAGIGWRSAGVLFGEDTTVPIVAAIQFEGSRHQSRDAAARMQMPEPAPFVGRGMDERAGTQPDSSARLADEERKLADALEWAEKYRQRQDAIQWEALARNQQEIQRLARTGSARVLAQAGSTRTAQRDGEQQKVAHAGVGLQKELLAEKPAGTIGSSANRPQEQCASSCVVKAAQTSKRATGHRKAHRRHARVKRAKIVRSREVLCPLRWLEAVLTEPSRWRVRRPWVIG